MNKSVQRRKIKKIQETSVSSPSFPTTGKDENFYIAGIGASAGGLEALKLFFDNAPPDIGMAFIIVQHLDPTHKSMLAGLLASHTKMQVAEVRDGMRVKPDCVYIIPPNKDLRIFHKTLELINPPQSRSFRRPIDYFFHSLAEDQKENAIGIVLSGTGSEGTAGLKDIKMEGGMTIVQEPHSAQFTGMPESAITAKTADFILAPEKMPEQLLRYIKKGDVNVREVLHGITVPLENQLRKILLIIRNQTGYDFSNYKTNTIFRRINKRISLSQVNSIEEYIDFLQVHPDEVVKLYKDFLIGVTSFFRNKEVFDVIEKKAIPHLIEKCIQKQEIRVWACGCSTGEEAYSLAILFKEILEKRKQYINVMIFATDIDKEAIELARNGFFSESIAADIPDSRLSRYFVKKENGYQLKKEIREMVVFAHHNVIKDPPFSKIDMITCRNLLIYINSELQKRIIPVFHYSLNNDGILVLGASESIGDFTDLFSVFDDKIKIFRKKNIDSRKTNQVFELSFNERKKSFTETEYFSGNRKKAAISGIPEKILLDQYAPPSVIIDKNNDALYFSGKTGIYLEPAGGTARLNILDMAKKGLKKSLEKAIKRVRESNTEGIFKGIEVLTGDYFKTINLVVKPLGSREYDTGTLMIIFEPVEKPSENKEKVTHEKTAKPKLNAGDLEKELKITRDHLQTAINELESSNQDLQSTNEEFQSSNEELQSTNEELETSREELQSVNEELLTVNTELTGKIDQLSQANNDLNNLLRSIEVATIYLDRDLKIKRFTPAASKIFNLIPSDIDRPVTQLSSNLLYTNLAEDVRHALKTLAVKSVEVNTNEGLWYYMRIIPYRTAENIIEGVLVTLIDISEQKIVELKLEKTNEHLNLIMENLPAVPYTCSAETGFKIDFVGKSSEKVTGYLPEQFTGKKSFWASRIHPADKKKILAAFSGIQKKGIFDQRFRWKCANGKYKLFLNHIRYAAPENGRPAYIVGVWQEIFENNKEKRKMK